MTTNTIFKVSVATSSKSGAFVVRDLTQSRLFYQSIYSGVRGDALPQLPEHELILPNGGWLEDFILGDFGNPYVSSRAAELLDKEWGHNLEFFALKDVLQLDYYMLVVRPALRAINGQPCLINDQWNKVAFLDEGFERLGVFKVAGREKSLFATSFFGEFVQKHSLTGVYLRDPEVLLKKSEMPFGLPIMKHNRKPILEV